MQVEDLGSVERDAVVCVSAHRRYVRPQESERLVEPNDPPGGSTGLWAESAIYDCLVDAGGGPGLGGA